MENNILKRMQNRKARLELIYDNDSIILHRGNVESCEVMLNWYESHGKFFNGDFEIIIEKGVIK